MRILLLQAVVMLLLLLCHRMSAQYLVYVAAMVHSH
jgi:hypothetical protein